MRATAVKYQELTKTQEFIPETKGTVAHREFLDWWKWDSIGAACAALEQLAQHCLRSIGAACAALEQLVKCGGCRCRNCQPGGKEMTRSEERELEIIRKGLTYIKADAHSGEPHWDTKYPWIQDPSSLPNNRSGVEATSLRTERQLKKEAEWKMAYTAQVHEMVERRAAKKLTKEIIASWKGPVWYVSHLVAPNPHSLSTPVRLVWNSSQKFKGVSMNDLLLKGPDVLNRIRAVLLRFRRGIHAALGDIKMYNSVWLEDLEMHLHRFLWRDTEEGEIEEYAITRVNIVDRPAGCIAQLAMRETAKLPMFADLEEERRILEEDTYVDDILTSHNDLQKLNQNIKLVEEMLKAGGFFLKPWVQSGQSGRQEIVPGEQGAESNTVFILPNQMRKGDNKAVGVGYFVEEDKLYLMTSINFSKRKKEMRVGQNLLNEEVRGKTPNRRAWVIKGRKLAKESADICVECRKARAKRCQQIMSDLPFERITPARPFEYTTVDLFGPYEVKDEGKSELENEASKHGTEWSWKIHPADSPHRNGAAEAAVGTVKRALHNVGGEGLLTWNEFQTFLYMAANLANERPIDARTQSQEDCIEYISPNSLLLGRTGPRGDLGCFEFENYPYKRLRAIQTEVNRFWRKWSQLAGPNLFVRSKWHTTQRNVAVGDVVWLADQNAWRGQYRLGRVISVNIDKKGIVRDVHVRSFPSYPVPTVKPAQEKSKKLSIKITCYNSS
ncbi:uncharacterized protein LOC106611916 [Tachysurus ichikawai]